MIWRIQWQNLQWWWLAALIFASMLAAVGWLYRGQGRSMYFFLLRSIVLAVVACVILRPVILAPIRDDQRGVVAVLVDQSRSMSIVDAERSPVQLVQLAAALGAIPESLRASTLSDFRQQVDDLRQPVQEIARSRSELDYARLAGRGIESAEAHLRQAREALGLQVKKLTASSPPSLAESVAHIDGDFAPGRIDRVVEQIDVLQSAEDQRLYQENDGIKQICEELSHQPRIELVRRALIGRSGLLSKLTAQRPVRVFGFDRALVPLSLPADRLAAGGSGTDLPRAIRDLRQRLTTQRMAGIVVLSDGRSAGGQANAALPPIDVPVFAIEAAMPVQHDLAISGVSMPASVFIGQTIQMRVDVRAVGYDEQQIEIVVDGAAQHQSQTVVVHNETFQAVVALKLTQAGPQELTIRIAPMEGEATEENNQVRRVLKVIADPVKVAMIKGDASSDYQYLHDALEHDPGVTVIEPPTYAGRVAMTPEQILAQDLLILSDVPAAALGARQWDAINRLLTIRGGGVIFMTARAGIASGYASNPLAAALLPWRPGTSPALRVWPGVEPVFHILPGADMPGSIQWWEDSEESPLDWTDLPAMFRYLSIPPLRIGAKALLIERDSGQPVLTEYRVGAGRAFFLGVDEFWQWRSSLNQHEPHQLWRALVQYAVQAPYAVRDGAYALDADALQLEPGQPLRVRTRVAVDADGPIMLQVWRNGDPVSSRDISADALPAGRFDLVLPGLPEGSDELRLVWNDGVRSLSLPVRVESSVEEEMNDVSGDERALERLAPGPVLHLDELGLLPERLAKLRDSEPRFAERRLWDSPYLFLFVLGCLGLEWALRKRAGLV